MFQILAVVVAYELVRFVVVGRVRRALAERAVRFVRQHRIELESARFIDRVWMREKLAGDPAIDEAIARVARAEGASGRVLRERVDTYVNEIAPYFSVTAYWWFGKALARRVVNFCFELVVDREGFDDQAKRAPEGAVRVYVINHRANMDPLILAYALLDRVPLSYAVGEWALVWPLDWLFRSFGSYFVRRGESDPLYHTVLSRFVQLMAGHGAVTGFFIEGGLSRDGALRRPRSGLLDYIIGLRREWPDREIVFMPVGLNYDRVLEDRILTREASGPLPKPTPLERLFNLVGLLFWLPVLVLANVLKVATRSHRKFGYAAICFGEPLALTEWPGGPDLHTLDDEERTEGVRELACELLYNRIGRVVPATPVPILCEALLREGPDTVPAVQGRIRDVLKALRAVDAPVSGGEAFQSIEARREHAGLESIRGIDEAFLREEEAEQMLLLATTMLSRRRLLKRVTGQVERLVYPADKQVILTYYANSIRHHLDHDGEVMAEA